MAKKEKRREAPQETDFAYSVRRAGIRLGEDKAFVYNLISTGALWMVTVGNRRLVPRSALEGYMESQTRSRRLQAMRRRA